MQLDKRAVIILVSAGVIIIGAFLVLVLWQKQPTNIEKVELEFWGVFDDSDIYKNLIKNFNTEYPHIKINYYKKNIVNYEDDFLGAVASGRGPDIFMLHNTWIPRYENKIIGAPQTLVTAKQVQTEFVDVVYDDFVVSGVVGALPLSVDTLALFYNKNIFNNVAIPRPPETWQNFLTDVEKITVRDQENNITRAGAAIGTARSINRSTDILSLLMFQSGTPIVDRKEKEVVFDDEIKTEEGTFYPGQEALSFYTDFANPLKSVYTWNNRMHYSIDAFKEGIVGMMLNYSYQIEEIRQDAPYLEFGVSYAPQIKEAKNKVNYANYWGLAVSKNSKHSKAAWQFINWLTRTDNYRDYLKVSNKPTARRDLINWQKQDEDLGIFAEQTLSAHSWYQVNNIAIEQYLADMIESVVTREAKVEEAIKKAAERIRALGYD